MKKLEDLLNSLAEAYDALHKFEEKHQAVFVEHDSLQVQINELTEKIKLETKEEGIDTETERGRVEFTRAFSSWYNIDKLQPKTIKLLEKEGGIKTEVVKAVFDDLVKLGKIDESEKAAAFEEKELQSRVLIKLNQE